MFIQNSRLNIQTAYLLSFHIIAKVQKFELEEIWKKVRLIDS